MPVYKYQEFKTSDGTVFDNQSDAHVYELKYQLNNILLPILKRHSNVTHIREVTDTVIALIQSNAGELCEILNDYLNEQTCNYK